MICVQDNSAGEKFFENFQDIVDLRLRQYCGPKCFEFLQDNDDLRRRQFCRRKSF